MYWAALPDDFFSRKSAFALCMHYASGGKAAREIYPRRQSQISDFGVSIWFDGTAKWAVKGEREMV